MKKVSLLLLSLVFLLSLAACNSASGQGSANTAENQPSVQAPADVPEDASQEPQPEQAPSDELEPDAGGKTLVAYFSATGNTEAVAQHLGNILDAEIYEIVPEEPYSSADLNYNTDCRANREQNDSSARPGISGSVEELSQYDVVFLGYPIWWGEAPKIMYTFLENGNFSGKTIVPFCTSGSSGIGSSATNLAISAGSAEWLEGHRFSGGASESDVQEWVDGLGLNG